MYQGCPCQGEGRGTGGDRMMLKIKGIHMFRKGINLAGLSQVQICDAFSGIVHMPLNYTILVTKAQHKVFILNVPV
jgi:hypothetical protein